MPRVQVCNAAQVEQHHAGRVDAALDLGTDLVARVLAGVTRREGDEADPVAVGASRGEEAFQGMAGAWRRCRGRGRPGVAVLVGVQLLRELLVLGYDHG